MSKSQLPAEDGKTVFGEIVNPKKRAFLAAVAKTGSIAKASKTSKVSSQSHYNWLKKNDEAYKLAFDRAKEIFGDVLEGVFLDAVMNGDEEPIIYQGKIRGRYKKKSDILRICAVKRFKPEYRDNYLVANQVGPVSVNFTFAPSSLPEKPTATDAKVIDKDGTGNGEAKS